MRPQLPVPEIETPDGMAIEDVDIQRTGSGVADGSGSDPPRL